MGVEKTVATVVTAAAESVAQAELRSIKALVVRSVAAGFRRIGIAFTREAVHLDPTLLTKDQVQALKSEPNLVVTEAKVTVPAPLAKPSSPIVVPVDAPASSADQSGAKD